MISFVNAQDPVKIRSCSKAFLLTIPSSNIVSNSTGYIKGDEYLFFCKSRCGKCFPRNKLFIKTSRDTLQKDHVHHAK